MSFLEIEEVQLPFAVLVKYVKLTPLSHLGRHPKLRADAFECVLDEYSK